jgi:hypothetical protein
MWPALLGCAAVAVSLLMGLWVQHIRERPVYQRPSLLIHPSFWRIWLPARWLLFAGGMILLGRFSLLSAAALAALLLALLSWKRYLAGRRHRTRMIRRAFERERERDSSASDAQILQRILRSLHGRWGDELIEQIVADNPTPEGVAAMVIRMERGILPPGFHPSRNVRRSR